MKKEKFTTGRIKQKLATRNRILETAQHMLETGTLVSLEEVAKAMNISRATIYRYYSDVDLLYTEAALSLRVKQPADFMADTQSMGLPESLLYVQGYFNAHAQLHETTLRKYLSVVLNESIQAGSSGPLRGARRPAALEAILQPYIKQIGVENYNRLKQIITVLSGIEPLIANKDVNGLSNEASQELLQWALTMILKGMGVDGHSLDQSHSRE
ncbi:TetR/AcrR family transcriptional regulator [Larkinella sp. C7]|uniref:TetR/AcrR family transcriptional regulator n=1 Tax=Larkinella sp. C7 TaxID=2576607 RepID=UPI0011115FA4|nr:TetR/AcrR family transcriptional regulator [Larkinella sp. C7]